MIILGLLLAHFAYAQEFICYGTGYSYTAKAPKGWVLDTTSGSPDGVCLVGYPKGGSWKNSATVIYINATTKSEKKGSASLSEMIDADVNQHKARNPKIEIKDGPTYEKNGAKISSKHFFNNEGDGGFEAVAYIDEPKAGIFVVMSSRTKKAFEKALPVLKEFVKSYSFITSDVKIETRAK